MMKNIRQQINLIKEISQIRSIGVAIALGLPLMIFAFAEMLYFRKLNLWIEESILFLGLALMIIIYLKTKDKFYNTNLQILSRQVCNKYLSSQDYTEIIPNSIKKMKTRNSNLVINENPAFYAIIHQEKIMITAKQEKNFNFIIIDEIEKEEFLNYYSIK